MSEADISSPLSLLTRLRTSAVIPAPPADECILALIFIRSSGPSASASRVRRSPGAYCDRSGAVPGIHSASMADRPAVVNSRPLISSPAIILPTSGRPTALPERVPETPFCLSAKPRSEKLKSLT